MTTISFYPGPSRVHDEVPTYVKDAAKLGIMSINHRSDDFMKMSETTISLLREKLNIPKDYTVLYTGSATECWEIIAQSLVTNNSFHIYNGAFGQKWFEYTKRICPGAQGMPFDLEEKPDVRQLTTSTDSVICVTQNETSNGTQVSGHIIQAIKKQHPDALVAVDATSSMAGIELDFKSADVWYASVQKCFGLPAGMALMICSPQAVARAYTINERNHYNSLPFMLDMMKNFQTPFTPNVLGVYLLMRVMRKARPIEEVEERIVTRFNQWEEFFDKHEQLKLLVQNKAVRSQTVLPVATSSAEQLAAIKSTAKKNKMLLGEGYGAWKATTFRIANFPALRQKEVKSLQKLLQKIA